MLKSCLKTMSLVVGCAVIACGCGEQKQGTPQAVSIPAAKVPAAQPTSDDAKPLPAPMEKAQETASNLDVPKPVDKPAEKPALTPTDPALEKPTTPATSAVASDRDKMPRPEKLVDADLKPEAHPFAEGRFLADDVIALFVFHPRQFSNSPIGRMLTELGVEDYTFRGNGLESVRQHLSFAEIERLTVVINSSFAEQLQQQFAMQAGMPVRFAAPVAMEAEVVEIEAPADDAAAPRAIPDPTADGNPLQLTTNLKQIALAFHNYHDVNDRLPHATGEGSGKGSQLSWRVHLLPFLDQGELYQQFHLDEPWDSEHNKSLIAQMPKIFQSPGVTEEGKTSIHVFAGEKTLFYGEAGPRFQEITDGTSNTILAVVAGSDTADIWTKPGGLEVDLADPAKSLGDLEDEFFLVILVDGSVRQLDADIDPTMLANLIQPADGNPVELSFPMEAQPAMPTPVMILALVNDAKQEELTKAILGESSNEECEGQTIAKNATTAVWFADAKTVVLGPVDSVKQTIVTKKSGREGTLPLADQLQIGADFTMAISVESQKPTIEMLAEDNPVAGMILNVKTLSTHLNFAAKEGESLIEMNIGSVDPNMAMGLSAVAKMGLEQAKMTAQQMPKAPNQNANDEELQSIVKRLIAATSVELIEDRIVFKIPAPAGFDRLPELLKPALANAIAAARDSQFTNSLKMIGLAFHNFHDTMNAFPGAGRMNTDKPVGLSWRVYLLPFLDQAPLYNQFKFDEPWDSEHNKALIERMPAIFKSPGVDEVGKTSFHVFVGPGSPFADDATPKIADFTDGLSNTILAVLAGPDTAEIWTKPGGLDFDPAEPLKALGNLIGEKIVALFADGSVQSLDKNIDGAVLRRMIQYQDGEPLQ